MSLFRCHAGTLHYNGNVLIVGECSTIDIILMYSLLKAIPDNMTLILADDIYQLPIVYENTELDELVLACTTTIHKAQGCEFPYIIIAMMM